MRCPVTSHKHCFFNIFNYCFVFTTFQMVLKNGQ